MDFTLAQIIEKAIIEVENYLPGTFLQLGVGLLAAISRLAYDAQSCERGIRGFAYVFGRQLILAVTFVVVAHGITTHHDLPRPISVSIILLAGFFVREIVEQGRALIKKIPCFLSKLIERYMGSKK